MRHPSVSHNFHTNEIWQHFFQKALLLLAFKWWRSICLKHIIKGIHRFQSENRTDMKRVKKKDLQRKLKLFHFTNFQLFLLWPIPPFDDDEVIALAHVIKRKLIYKIHTRMHALVHTNSKLHKNTHITTPRRSSLSVDAATPCEGVPMARQAKTWYGTVLSWG